jgi:proline dehydrogenase
MPVEPRPLSFDDTAIAFSYKSDSELRKARFLFSMMNNNSLVKIGTSLTPLAFKWHLPINGIVRSTIYSQFCGGEILEECGAAIDKLAKFQVKTILDYGVEGHETEENFEANLQEMLRAIAFAKINGNIPFASMKVTGYARFALLEKINYGELLSETENEEWQKAKLRIREACASAKANGIALMIDAEESWIQNTIDDVTNEMMSAFNKEKAAVLNTFQLYRHDRLAYLKKSFSLAQSGNYLLGAKLVRGAYMEKERKRAVELNYASPIQPNKKSTDNDYNNAVKFCSDNIERICFCVASHNENSNRHAADLVRQKNIPANHPHLHFSQLYGMSDNLTFNLAAAGYNASKYLPYGPVKDVVPYLMRRAKENTSVAGQTGRELSLLRKEMKRRKN